MAFVVIGVLLLGLWLGDIGPFGRLDWWWVALPFGLAVLWWEFADSSGWTKRRAMDKMEQRKIERRNKSMEALGLKVSGQRPQRAAPSQASTRQREGGADAASGGRDAGSKSAKTEAEARREPRL